VDFISALAGMGTTSFCQKKEEIKTSSVLLPGAACSRLDLHHFVTVIVFVRTAQRVSERPAMPAWNLIPRSPTQKEWEGEVGVGGPGRASDSSLQTPATPHPTDKEMQ
jgi:hypothetical protein